MTSDGLVLCGHGTKKKCKISFFELTFSLFFRATKPFQSLKLQLSLWNGYIFGDIKNQLTFWLFDFDKLSFWFAPPEGKTLPSFPSLQKQGMSKESYLPGGRLLPLLRQRKTLLAILDQSDSRCPQACDTPTGFWRKTLQLDCPLHSKLRGQKGTRNKFIVAFWPFTKGKTLP